MQRNNCKKVILILIPLLVGILLCFLSFKLYNYYKYQDFYQASENICENPGMDEGFIPQGIAVCDSEKLILTSGYMEKTGESRIYIIENKEKSRFVDVYYNGKAVTNHMGGIAISGDNVYLSSNRQIFQLSKTSLLNAVEIVELEAAYNVNNRASFVECDDEYLYVGEFYYKEKYQTNHYFRHEKNEYYAICSAYRLEDLSTPVYVYAIPNMVQGFCVTDDKQIVLSISYGLKDAKFYVYEPKDIILSDDTHDGIPLYYLIEPSRIINAPIYSEDLAYYNGKIYGLTEKHVTFAFTEDNFIKLSTNKIFAFRGKDEE